MQLLRKGRLSITRLFKDKIKYLGTFQNAWLGQEWNNIQGIFWHRSSLRKVSITSHKIRLAWLSNRIKEMLFTSAFLYSSNHTLLSMPMPLHDAAQSLKPQTEQHLRKVNINQWTSSRLLFITGSKTELSYLIQPIGVMQNVTFSQWKLQVNTCKWRQARENASVQVAIGFGLHQIGWQRYAILL